MRIKSIILQLLINGFGKGVGFVREVLISGLFGVSSVTDAFFGVQQVFVFFTSYMMGAFNLAFVPAYVKSHASGAAVRFLRPLALGGLVLGTLFTVLLFQFEEAHARVLFGFSNENPYLLDFLHVLAWTVVPTVFIGLAFGVLHGEQRHQFATVLGIVSSIGMVLALLLAFGIQSGESISPSALPLSYLLGVFLAGAIAVVVIASRVRGELGSRRVSKSEFFRSLAASSVENIGFNFNQLTNVYFAARLGEGLVAINAFAFRVGMLPLALVSSQLGQIYQAWAARAKAKGEPLGSRVFLLLCLPSALIALAVAYFGEAIVRIVYERGEFTAEQTALVAPLLVPYAAYFFVMSVNQLAARHMFVLGRGREYSICMLLAYAAAFLGKLLVAGDLSGIVWTCVVAEGAVAAVLTARISLERNQA